MIRNAGHDALIEEIKNDARKKADRIAHKAEREAAEIREKAEREAEAARLEILQSAQKKADAERNVILATVAVDAKRIEMDVKELAVNQAFYEAEEKIKLREFDYLQSLSRLIAAAAKELGDDELRVALNEKDFDNLDHSALSERVNRMLVQPAALFFERDNPLSSGGAVVKSTDGRRICDNTYSARMLRTRDDLRQKIAQVLFNPK